MGKLVTQRGPQTNRYEFRKAIGQFPGYGGMRVEDDPGSIPATKFQMAVNSRHLAGEALSRPGQALVNSSALHGASACINPLVDFQLATPRKLWLGGDGCPGVSATVGAYVGTLDGEQSPEYQPAIYFNGAAANVVIIGPFDDQMYLGIDNELRVVNLLPVPYGESALDQSGRTQDIQLNVFSGFTVSALQGFDAKLFIGLDAGAGASKIVTWDGATLRDDITGIDVVQGFGLYRDRLIAGFPSATGHIRVRTEGSSPGTWTTVSLAGAGMSIKGVSYKDNHYHASGGSSLYRYDGTTLTEITNATIGIAAADTIVDVDEFNNFLYFLYTKVAAPVAVRVGKYDGTTFTPIEKDLTAQIAAVATARVLRRFRQNLIAGAIKTAVGALMYESPGTATNGTWREISPSGAASGDLTRMVVF